MNQEATKELLYKMADDALIIGHRNSEWTGLGPQLEEDIAFSSMAQDKMGHALALYKILNEELGEKDPDTIAFWRNESEFKCCHLVEEPIGEYDFSLIRQFLFDHAEAVRYRLLSDSSFKSLAQLANKVKGEIKYHTLHADTWVKKLGNGNEESHARLQSSLNDALPLALGIFEPGDHEETLQKEGVFAGEEEAMAQWLQEIEPVLQQANLKMPDPKEVEPSFGGRKGYHTEHLKPLLDEMTEVMRMEPGAEW